MPPDLDPRLDNGGGRETGGNREQAASQTLVAPQSGVRVMDPVLAVGT